MMKNIEYSKVTHLIDEVSYMKGQVISKTLSQNKNVSLTLFSFDKGEELSTHTSPGDAMVQVLDGSVRITIDGVETVVNTNETIVMPANHPHALFALTPFKMLLTVILPHE